MSRSPFDIFCVEVIRTSEITSNDAETRHTGICLITSYTRLVLINAPSVTSLTDTAVTVYVAVFDRRSLYAVVAVKLLDTQTRPP